MSTRQDYVGAIDKFVQGNIPLDEGDKEMAISQAIKEHSRHKPQKKVQDVDGDGGFDYAVSDLTYWSTGFSVIKQVEYPVDDDDETPDVLQDDEWMIYSKPDGDVLRFLENTPSSSEDIRITYTALHTCTDSACTVDDYDEESVQALAAGYFCDMISTYYAQSGDSTIEADSVDHKSKSAEYEKKAKRFRKAYFDHMGIKEGQTKAASVTRDQDKNASWASDKITHKGKYR